MTVRPYLNQPKAQIFVMILFDYKLVSIYKEVYPLAIHKRVNLQDMKRALHFPCKALP